MLSKQVIIGAFCVFYHSLTNGFKVMAVLITQAALQGGR